MVWPSTESDASLLNNIVKDLKAFSVLNEVEVAPRKTGFRITFETNRGKVSAEFQLDKDNRVIVKSRQHPRGVPYRKFLSSEALADLNSIADVITKIVGNPAELPYVECQARSITEEGSGIYGDVTNIVEDVLSEKYLGRTNLVFLKGPAGSGKSFTLKKLTRDKAGYYLQKGDPISENGFLYLYIDAQGKALTNLDEIFAKTLDDLGARFSYRAIYVLTRNSLIIPVIDGFDELIGSGGYAEAFKSLSNFLAFTEGSGAILAAGRSSFYDNEVWRKATGLYKSSETYSYELTSITIQNWEESKIDGYFVEFFGEDEEALNIARSYLSGATTLNKELLSKPFYTAEIAKYIRDTRGPVDPDEEILDFLVRGFIKREAGKFKDRQGEYILSVEQHLTLLKLWAEEMWWLEKRDLDMDTMLVYVQSAIEDWRILPENEAIIMGKIPSYALFKIIDADAGKTYSFEHDEYYEYFLLCCLEDFLSDTEKDMVSFLNRSLLSDSFLNRFGLLVTKKGPGIKIDWYRKLMKAARSARPPSNLSTNIGLLACKVLDKGSDLPPDLEMHNLDIPEAQITGVVLERLKIANCTIGDLSIINTRLIDADIENSYIRLLRMNEASFLSGSRLIPGRHVEAIFDSENRIEIRNPLTMAEYLVHKEADVGEYVSRISQEPTLTDQEEAIIDLLYRFLSQAKRSYFFSIPNDPGFSSILRDPNWPEMEKLLRKHNLLIDKKRGGVDYPLQHLTQPFDLIKAGQSRERSDLPKDVSEFWDDVYSIE